MAGVRRQADRESEPVVVPPAAIMASTGFLLSQAAQLATQLVEDALTQLDIRFRHYGVLALLNEAGALPQVSIGERLRVDRTTVVSLIDDLEQRGLVRRQTDPHDRRAYRVQLTEDGERVRAQANELITAAEASLLTPLSGWERRHLRNLLLCLAGFEQE